MTAQKLIFESQKCTGCRACEIACTFHHRGEFGRHRGSLEVKRDTASGEIELIYFPAASASRPACDLCVGEKTVRCVEFCSPQAITLASATEDSA